MRWERGLSPFLLIGATVLLSHAPLLRAGYVQDDHLVVEADRSAPLLLGSYWEGISGGDRSLYRPVTLATYAAERAAAGRARPDVSHAVNLVLHMGVAALVLALGRRAALAPAAAALGALLFALTPAKVEAVANVVGRAELLAALFTLAAVGLAATATRAGAWGAAACVLLACGSKETGFVVVPLVACAALLTSQSRRTRWGVVLPSLLAFEIAAIARTLALEAWFPRQTVPVIDNPLVAMSGVPYVATALGVAARAAGIVVAPWGLAGDYSGTTIPPEAGLLAWRPLVGGGVLGVLAALAIAGLLTRRSAIAWGGFLAIGAYLMTSNLLVPVGAIFAERFLYLPAAGLALLAASALDRAGPRARWLAAGLCAVYGVLTFFVATGWRSDASRFAAIAHHNPKSPRAALWLGVLAAERGDDAAARSELAKAAALGPDSAAPYLHLGLLDAKAGDFPSAARAFEEASRREPTWAPPQLNLALARHRAGDREAAERAARRACLLDPNNPRAWAELGHLRYERGAKREAIEPYRRAVALGRGDLAARLAECEAS